MSFLQIGNGIAMLSVAAQVMGRPDTVHPTLLWDDEDVVLVDTGFPGQIPQLRAAAEACGVLFERVNRIVMTHQDIDHIGNLQALTEASPSRIEVSAHPLERPYIQGDRRLLKFTDEAIASLDKLPDHVPETFRTALRNLMLHPPRAAVDRDIRGGMRLPWCGGITVIDTPGHTPGHVSLYHESTRTLIAGDALVVKDGRLYGSDPGTTLDRHAARASVAKLAELDIASVVCYHGGLFRDRIQDRLAEIANETE